MPQDPDDERDDEPEFVLPEAVREQLRASLAPITNEINARLTRLLAPVLQPINAHLAEAAAPLGRLIQQQWSEAFSGIDLRPLLPAFQLPPDLVERVTRWRELAPPNWPRAVDGDRLTEALVAQGIPLVWAPWAEVVAQVLAADSRTHRVAVLLENRADVIEDCDETLAGVTSPTYAGKVELARQALNTLKAGHHQAAQALAVVVVESAVTRAIHRNYDTVKRHAHVPDMDALAIQDLRLRAGLAPLHLFFTHWEEGKSPGPMPEELSRHVTVHSAAPQHFTEGNALLAVLLAATILRALEELEEIRTSLGDATWLPS